MSWAPLWGWAEDRPGQDVVLQVGPAWRGPWLGRAGLWQAWSHFPTSSLGQGQRDLRAGMGSWAMGRLGRSPGAGKGTGVLMALVPLFFPRSLLFRNTFVFGTTTSSQVHQPLVFPVSMVYTHKHSMSCNHGCIPYLTCHLSLVQVLP